MSDIYTTADLNAMLAEADAQQKRARRPMSNAMLGGIVPQVSAQDAARNRPEPVERASLFPLATYPDGSTRLALPGMIAEDIPRAFTAPARAYRGEIADEDMIAEGLNFGGTMAMGGSVVPKPSNAAGMFGGRLAKTADHAKLATAEKMAAEGAPREAIWRDTGWFQGVDGKWRFEIDDSKAKIGFRNPWDFAAEGKFSDVLRHPELNAAYPDVGTLPAKAEIGFTQGYYERDPSIPGVRVYASGGDQNLPGIALHEGQHAIQDREGFARGGGMRSFSDADLSKARDLIRAAEDNNSWSSVGTFASDMSDDALKKQLYQRLAGETEARTVQARQHLTPEQRASRPPWLDYDVPESQQIVRFNANATESAAPGVVVSEAARAPRPVQMEVPFFRGSGHAQTSVDYSRPYWGTTDRATADFYARSMAQADGSTPNVTPAVARFRNPMLVDAQGAGFSEIPFDGKRWSTDDLAAAAKERGHDGLVIDRLYDGGRWNPDEGLPATVAALGPGTVSSAFDPNTILYANRRASSAPGVLMLEGAKDARQ